MRFSAPKQGQVPGDRDLANLNASKSAVRHASPPARGPRTRCGVGTGHAAAGPEAGGFQTMGVTDMRDAQPT